MIEAPTVKAQEAASPTHTKADLNIKVTSVKKGDGSPLFAADDDKEQIEHNFGFSGHSIEEYSAVIENKLDALHSIEEQKKS